LVQLILKCYEIVNERNSINMKIKEYKFLTFNLNNDIYGIEMLRVKEIIGIINPAIKYENIFLKYVTIAA